MKYYETSCRQLNNVPGEGLRYLKMCLGYYARYSINLDFMDLN